MKDLAPHWVALVGVLSGALIAAFSGFITSFFAFRRERWLRRREEKIRKYEAIYEGLSRLHAMIASVITPACFELAQGRVSADITKKFQQEDSTRLDMLVGLYAPEIAEHYEPIRTRYSQLLLDLMQTALDVANHRSPQKGIETMLSRLHDLSKAVVDLQKELARLARTHDL
jgi:hypothetical protein